MTDRCLAWDPLIEKLLADEIRDDERDRLLEHCQTCPRCLEFVELDHGLQAVGLELMPTDQDLRRMRREVLRRLRSDSKVSGGRRGAWLGAPLARPLLGVGLAAMLLVAFGAGVWLGRGAPPVGSGQGELVGQGILLPELNEAALAHRQVADVEQSPFFYSNVLLEERDGGSVRLRFDVSRHFDIVRPREDPLVREALVQALLSGTSLGTRLQAVDWSEGHTDPQVRQALVLTMLNDPSQAVRTRALEHLASRRDHPLVQEALLAVLRGEESMHMRLTALDLLARSDPGTGRIGEAVRELRPDLDRALLVRAAGYGMLEPEVEQ